MTEPVYSPHKVTTKTERSFAEQLRQNILLYWKQRGYAIEVWVDPPEKLGGRNSRLPIYPLGSNIGPTGYPPKKYVQ